MSIFRNRAYWWGVATGVLLVLALSGLACWRTQIELERWMERTRTEAERTSAARVDARPDDQSESGEP